MPDDASAQNPPPSFADSIGPGLPLTTIESFIAALVEAGPEVAEDMPRHRSEQGDEVVEVANPHALEVGVVVERVDQHRVDSGGARAFDVGRRRVADVEGVLGCHVHRVECESEDRGVGLVDADDA